MPLGGCDMDTALGPSIDGGTGLALVCRVRGRLCALPLEHVAETMRALPVEALAGAPRCVLGLATIRGVPVPVVDAAGLLGDEAGPGGRWVALKLGARHVALAVDEVPGVRALPAGSRFALPPLLGDMRAEVVAAIGLLDAELLLVLQGARLLSAHDWAALDLARAAA
jgi:purine-binding chemotaxis protein CheW